MPSKGELRVTREAALSSALVYKAKVEYYRERLSLANRRDQRKRNPWFRRLRLFCAMRKRHRKGTE